MTLDSWLVARLARELELELTGARVSDFRGADRRLTLACYRRRDRPVLQAFFDPEKPLVAVASDDGQAKENGPGCWTGGVAALLRGSVVDAVRAVPDDRILNVDVSSRSAFGVPARHRLVLELEPRKANALVLRPVADDAWIVLAAARSVTGAGTARDVTVGERYEAPPPRVARIDRDGFRAGVMAALAPATPELRSLARLLAEYDPGCTPPLARNIVQNVFADTVPTDPAGALLHAWASLRPEVERASTDPTAPLYIYSRGDEVIAFHVVPLAWAAGDVSRAVSLNDLCARELARAERKRIAPAGTALRKKLERMLKRCDEESAGLRLALERADAADSLRAIGDAIYANLASIPEGASDYVTDQGVHIALDPLRSAKQNAAEQFKRYRKARSGLPRITARLDRLAANRRYWEHLLWELERADADPSLRAGIYEEVSSAIERRPRLPASPKKKRSVETRATPSVELPGGATAFVGRSPKDNERLTFAVARPHDFWFHARGIPGAHVILKLPHASDSPTPEQIEKAAALAAGASRASGAAKAEVDYTQRKHVRRQGKGATGLVWYTDFKTVLVTPERR